MIFYAIFPILILLINSCRVSFIFLIISIIISCALRSALHTQYLGIDPTAKYDWSYFTFPSNIYFFAMGIYAYLLGQFYPKNSKLISIYVPLIALVIIFGLLFSDLGLILNNSGRLDLVLWGIGLTALCIWQANHPSAIISNKIFLFMGERSYSIYMLHPVIIFFTKGVLLKTYTSGLPFVGAHSYFISLTILIIMILVATEFTYRAIELPGIHLGQRLLAGGKHV
jgi:peptidoglycan/LPS O-acetylase OafA/YrhL